MQMTPASTPSMQPDTGGNTAAVQRIELSPALPAGMRAALVLKDKVSAADDHPLALHPAGNAVGHDILHLRSASLRERCPARLAARHHGVCHGMGEMLFQTGGKAAIPPAPRSPEKGTTCTTCGRGMGQGAGLVEHDGVRLGQRLQILAALYSDVIFRCTPAWQRAPPAAWKASAHRRSPPSRWRWPG